MHLCANCLVEGFCKKRTTEMISSRRITDPNFLRDFRDFTSSLGISPDHWVDYLIDMYRDYPGRIVHNGNEVSLITNYLEADSMREWARDFLNRPIPNGVRPRSRAESHLRIGVVATILSIRYPFEVSMLGIRPANDNNPPTDYVSH